MFPFLFQIGSTSCAVKTVIVSEDKQTLKRLTFILSYFIRSSQPKSRTLYFNDLQLEQVKSQRLDIVHPPIPKSLSKKKVFARKSSNSCLNLLAKEDFGGVNRIESRNGDENSNVESRNVVFVVGGVEANTTLEDDEKPVKTGLLGNSLKVRYIIL